MLDEKSLENEAFRIDWSRVSENERARALNQYADYVGSSRMAIVGVSGFNTNARSLFLLMFAALSMALLQIDNRRIVISLLTLQLIKTLLARLVEIKAVEATKETQDKLQRTLEKMTKLEE